MRLTQTLLGPPVFHFWKDFGAGARRRLNHFRTWKYTWRSEIARKKVVDHTLPISQLPPGSRLMDAEDFLQGPIDALPDELIRRKDERIVYDHPWPFNVQIDPIKNQKPMYNYTIESRFYVPRLDSQVLTNTLLESDQLACHPPIEPTAENLDAVQRQYDWATGGDSVLVRLPNKREFPKINIRPRAKYGLTKERQEFNVMNFMLDISKTLLAKYYFELKDQEKLDEILGRRSISFPHCQVPFERESQDLNLDLCIDHMSLSRRPLPQINNNPRETQNRDAPEIKPRSWKSLLEKNNNYTPSWSFTLPMDAHPHTILLASRIKRKHLNQDEMLARSMIHAFGLTSQFARLRAYENSLTNSNEIDATKGSQRPSCVLQDPLIVSHVNDRELLDQPVVLQTISYDLEDGSFQFMRYQLNSVNFDDSNPLRVKNQAWHSGPIKELDQAFRYYLDFQSFDSNLAKRMLVEVENQRRLEMERAREEERQRLEANEQ